MFKLNRLTDYAVVILGQLEAPGRKLRSAQEIGQAAGIPLPTVAKVLNSLGRAGLVSAQRGAAGGYALERPAERITVADIVEALDGPIALTACVSGSEAACEVQSLCPMSGNWEQVNAAIRAALSAVTLADMMRPSPAALEARWGPAPKSRSHSART